MTIIEDVAQKENKHKLKNNYWKSSGIEVIRQPLPVGDYQLLPLRRPLLLWAAPALRPTAALLAFLAFALLSKSEICNHRSLWAV